MPDNADTRSLPVLYFFFNRPKYITESFGRIAKSRPRRLYVACDGPRMGVTDEATVVSSCRDQVLSQIDWDCDLRVFFSDRNHGRTSFIPMAIDWFFSTEPFGVIIEDDCIVSTTFFEFCLKLLESKAGDKKLCGVTGSFHYPTSSLSSNLFGATVFPSTWGWG